MDALFQDKDLIKGLFTVVGALMAVIGVILGSLLSARLTSKEEERRWEREKELRNLDERRRAYADLTRVSWRLYQEINAVDRELDSLGNKHNQSDTERTVTELTRLLARMNNNVYEEVQRAYDTAMEIRLLSAEPVIEAAIALAEACKALYAATRGAASLILDKMDESVDAESQADQDRPNVKEQFKEKQRDFINTARNDLLSISEVAES
jgi:hypothetical protein